MRSKAPLTIPLSVATAMAGEPAPVETSYSNNVLRIFGPSFSPRPSAK